VLEIVCSEIWLLYPLFDAAVLELDLDRDVDGLDVTDLIIPVFEAPAPIPYALLPIAVASGRPTADDEISMLSRSWGRGETSVSDIVGASAASMSGATVPMPARRTSFR
jgi:hypothetical protein